MIVGASFLIKCVYALRQTLVQDIVWMFYNILKSTCRLLKNDIRQFTIVQAFEAKNLIKVLCNYPIPYYIIPYRLVLLMVMF